MSKMKVVDLIYFLFLFYFHFLFFIFRTRVRVRVTRLYCHTLVILNDTVTSHMMHGRT